MVFIQTGLLTPRSTYLLRLPIFNNENSDIIATFVPGHSGGPVPEFHRLPY